VLFLDIKLDKNITIPYLLFTLILDVASQLAYSFSFLILMRGFDTQAKKS
jgi:hypothetical protein